ncbi:Sialic acid-binding Ig-like lectin 12 [Lemmus lemmus]
MATNNPNQPVKSQGQFHLSGDPRNNDCSLDIRDVQRTDNGSYFFRMEKDSLKWNYYLDQLSVQRQGGLGLAGKFRSIYISSGISGPLAEVVLVAIGEATIKFLLLGICFFFLR